MMTFQRNVLQPSSGSRISQAIRQEEADGKQSELHAENQDTI
jgi:hypothetical protein